MGSPLYILHVFRGVVVADGNDIEALSQRLTDDGVRVHVELPARGETGVHVEIAAEDLRHDITGGSLNGYPCAE
jgi:hypothetical protein